MKGRVVNNLRLIGKDNIITHVVEWKVQKFYNKTSEDMRGQSEVMYSLRGKSVKGTN